MERSWQTHAHDKKRTIPLWDWMIRKNWFVKSIVFVRDFPCFPCIGRFRSSLCVCSNEATWSTGPLHPILWIASENRVEPVASCTLVPSFLHHEREGEGEREKIFTRLRTTLIVSRRRKRGRRRRKRGEERKNVKCCSLFDRGYYLEDDWFSRVCTSGNVWREKMGFERGVARKWKRLIHIITWLDDALFCENSNRNFAKSKAFNFCLSI